MKAIILAGGFGTRLQSVVTDVPKPMAPIHGKPFLAYLIEYLATQGITDIILSVHYMRDKIQDFFSNSYAGVRIEYAIEENPLGTGGAIVNALQDNNEPVFVLNGDTLLKLNYQEMYAKHSSGLTMALRKIPDCCRYGVAHVDSNKVVSFQEKGHCAEGLINAGVYLLSKELFAEYDKKAFSFERDFLFPRVEQLKPTAFVVEDYFIDIGIPEDYQKAIADF